ncbi:MAG: metallophosphoesterase [Clostridia bacterium]|nr:metallophosphoesterase [Clostridia bacterium]
MESRPSHLKRLLHALLVLDTPTHSAQTEEIRVALPSLPCAFHGARVAVVSDVHLPDALLTTQALTRQVAALHPDAIFLTGDLTNAYATFAAEELRRLAKELTAIAPCFAIPGNHEWRLGREPRYRRILTACGVNYLCDSFADWHKDGQTLRLFGMGRRRPAPLPIEGCPSIVLAHKPQYFPYYQQARWHLVVCGHAHGGQMRAGDRGLYAPGQGFLPHYTAGIYADGNTTMVVSRGLGNSSIPGRFGNQPHLPLLVLTPAEKA